MQSATRIIGSRLSAIVTLILSMLLAGCPFGDGDSVPIQPPPPPPGPPAESTYSVGGTINGLTASELQLSLLYYANEPNSQPQQEDILVGSDGGFTFASRIPDGWAWEVDAGGDVTFLTSDRLQHCVPQPGNGVISSANVTGVVVTCQDAYAIRGEVFGLEPGSELVLELVNQFLNDILTISDNGSFEFDDRLVSGGDYAVSVKSQQSNPDQTCTVINSAGTVVDAHVEDIEVYCGDATVGGEVVGLKGTGLVTSLSREVTVNGNTSMLVVERDDIATSGPFTFDTTLDLGEPYIVDVWQQPTNPDQHCSALNGSGTIGDAGATDIDVTNVKVNCYTPIREYRFDTSQTIGTDQPLKSGRQEGGVLDDDVAFDDGSGGVDSDNQALRQSELFQNYFKRTGSTGVVYSSATGLTYWLAAEATKERGSQETSPTHYAQLKTYWRVRKESPQAKFELQITKVQMVAKENNHSRNARGHLFAAAELRIAAYRVNDPFGVPAPFFDTHGGIYLAGAVGTDGVTTEWELLDAVFSDTQMPLWSSDDFGDVQMIGESRPDKTAFAELGAPITVDVDLSSVPVGAEVLVVSEAAVVARNTYSPEGATAVFLRDPGDFEPGVTDGGVTVVNTEGLAQLDVGDLPLEDLKPGGPAPGPCDPLNVDRSVLELEAADYRVWEEPGLPPFVRVTRSGNPAGPVTVQVSLIGGSAEPDVDFEAQELTVRFDDLDDAPRTLELPIIDDELGEPDETFLVMLHTPAGCADVGAMSSATVTIMDNESGTASFDSDSYEIDEAAGVALVTLRRIDGDLGAILVSVNAADGTASAGSDYAPPISLHVFRDGDSMPRTVEIPIIDDSDAEADETVILSLSSSNEETIGAPDTAVLTIRDDDS